MLDLSIQWFFEDVEVGYKGESLGRTISYADIVNFANATRDYNVIHTDKEYSKKSLVGQVMAHGPLVYSLASGLLLRTEFGTRTLKTMLDFKGVKAIKLLKPVLEDDTIVLHFEVTGKEDVDEHTGMVEMQFNIVNQRGELAQTHTRYYLFAKRGYDFEGIAKRGSF